MWPARDSAPIDFVVAGLGNPGRAYERTRHNVGFLVVDALSRQWGIPVKKLKFQSLYGTGATPAGRVLLLKPQTFMNRSGEALRDCLAFYKLPSERLLVVYDEAALPPGRLRIRDKGSDGGHNGMKSILYQLQTDRFVRLRVGVGAPPHPSYDLADWVLAAPTGAEAKAMEQAVDRAAQAAADILRLGASQAANRYNAAPQE